MRGDRPRFRPDVDLGGRSLSDRVRREGVALAVLLFAVLIAIQVFTASRVPEGTLIEVVGRVPRPGMHLLANPTLANAVAAAGGDPTGLPDTALGPGDRVVVAEDGAHVAPAGDPLLVGLPVDVNSADAPALAAIPGLGDGLADAIVAERKRSGKFRDLDDLARVPGMSAGVIEAIGPFVVVSGSWSSSPDVPPIDVNTAGAAELERLPGIGAVTAARIVVERDEKGPFVTLDDLSRVPGIGPRTVEKLRGLAVAGPVPPTESAP